MRVVPAYGGSYERVFHETGIPAFSLLLRAPLRRAVREELAPPLLERAIGVVYRPDTERESHYFYASLPRQFDEYVWFDESRSVHALAAPTRRQTGLPDTYPFGL
jgi:protein-L-isoaspartate(D-aspartate) O-methyltransferase